jgi:hypothetical protein
MGDVEWAAERPREDKLAVAADCTIGGNTMRTFGYPIGNVFAIEGPEKAERTESMKRFINTHVAGSSRGGMISKEDSATERGRNNNQHEQFFVILDALKDDQAVVDNSDAVTANIIAVSGMNLGKRKGSERG